MFKLGVHKVTINLRRNVISKVTGSKLVGKEGDTNTHLLYCFTHTAYLNAEQCTVLCIYLHTRCYFWWLLPETENTVLTQFQAAQSCIWYGSVPSLCTVHTAKLSALYSPSGWVSEWVWGRMSEWVSESPWVSKQASECVCEWQWMCILNKLQINGPCDIFWGSHSGVY
jgi:hypothetical protein